MPEEAYASQDLALFVDLVRSARTVGLTPCLIGAGEMGEYLLGRDVGATFPDAALAPIPDLLSTVGSEGDSTLADVLRGAGISGDPVWR